MPNQWLPQVRRGFFHIGDRPFYLFAGKVTRGLGESAWLEFDLGEVPCAIHGASISGTGLPESAIILEGSTIYVRQDRMVGTVDLTYGIPLPSGSDIIQELKSTGLPPTGGLLNHYLDPIPVPGYPVVFKDPSGLPVEFTVDMETGKVFWFGLSTDINYVPGSGTFEYEGESGMGPNLDVDLNPANSQRQAGLLNLMSVPSRDIESELF